MSDKYTATVKHRERLEATYTAPTRRELEKTLRGHGCGQIRRERDGYTVFMGEGREAQYAFVKAAK